MHGDPMCLGPHAQRHIEVQHPLQARILATTRPWCTMARLTPVSTKNSSRFSGIESLRLLEVLA